MKQLILLFFVIASLLVFFGCSEEPSAPILSQSDQMAVSLAKKPSASLKDSMDIYFVPEAIPPDDPVWVGTITYEGYGTYGVRFFHTGGEIRGQANHFEEYFEIYDLSNPKIVYLGGTDFGVVSMANSRYRANGEVKEAYEPFEMWLGRQAHMSGIIIWQTLPDGTVIPYTAPGIFRIN